LSGTVAVVKALEKYKSNVQNEKGRAGLRADALEGTEWVPTRQLCTGTGKGV